MEPSADPRDEPIRTMEARDRRASLALFAVAAAAWVGVGVVVLTLDPRADPANGFIGAGAMGLAVALTTAPLFWLAGFGRRRIAYRGDWIKALRRAAWVGALVAILVVLRIQGILQLPIALFLIAMAVVAESALSTRI
ncbi:MAG TPA: hypothetical protein VKR30_08460 [Candidatus Limnocylindrales bacterium]|nr:hypothetical protein [Candidatus Limnocylindrales bacterium]